MKPEKREIVDGLHLHTVLIEKSRNLAIDQYEEHLKDYVLVPKEKIEDTEAMAEQVHKAYCQNQLDNGKEYWTKGDYSLLDEATKEIDRYTVRAIITHLTKSEEK